MLSQETTLRLQNENKDFEAYWVLFRFLYGGQFSDPVLIIVCDEVLNRLLDATSERGVELTGQGGFLNEFIKAVLERGMRAELAGHLGELPRTGCIAVRA